jgi:hypothetical protein
MRNRGVTTASYARLVRLLWVMIDQAAAGGSPGTTGGAYRKPMLNQGTAATTIRPASTASR